MQSERNGVQKSLCEVPTKINLIVRVECYTKLMGRSLNFTLKDTFKFVFLTLKRVLSHFC